MQESVSSSLRSQSFAERLDAPSVVRLPGTHLGLTWQEVTANDLPKLTALLECVPDSPLGHLPATARTVKQWYEEFTVNDNTYAIIGGLDSHNDLQAVAGVRVNDKPLSELQAEVFAVVSPQWLNRGIGRSLLEWQDDRARQLMAHYPSELPVSIRALVAKKNISRRRLLVAGGYTPISNITHVAVDLNSNHKEISQQARDNLVQHGLRIERYTHDVDAELRRLHNRFILTLERYQPLSVSAWQAKLLRASHDFSYLLIKDNQLVGYTLVECVPENKALEVYYYGIERSLRHHGIGTDLILAMLGPAYEAHAERVIAPVVSRTSKVPAELTQLGFEPFYQEVVYSLDIS